jgi:imidazole glycerol-phosphate synthase subunit HisF
MLKKRVIPLLLLRNGRMVKGRQFTDYRDTGDPRSAVRIYSAQDADELVFLDIQASLESRAALVVIVRSAASECFMPLAAGGGVASVDDVRQLLLAGADKVVINTAAALDPELVTRAARKFGSQCVVAGIDYRNEADGPRVWVRCGREPMPYGPLEHAERLVELGAGEVLLTCIDRDGMMKGYDLVTADMVARQVTAPVIVSGGAGNFMHLADALATTAVSAAACASLFHFGDNNPIRARSYLRNRDIPMRVLR